MSYMSGCGCSGCGGGSSQSFITSPAFEDPTYEYTGTDAEIKDRIASDLRLHVVNAGRQGYHGNLQMAIEKMAKVLTKAEFDEIYDKAIKFQEGLK